MIIAALMGITFSSNALCSRCRMVKKKFGTLSKQIRNYQELRIGPDISIRVRRGYCAYLTIKAPVDVKFETYDLGTMAPVGDEENEPTDDSA